MTNIEEVYQFALRVEEKLNKMFEGRQRDAFKEEGVVVGHLEAEMKPRRKMKMWVLARTK